MDDQKPDFTELMAEKNNNNPDYETIWPHLETQV